MQIVIDINDEIYKEILNGKDGWSNYVHGLIRTGIPIPKGHGRLIILAEEKLKESQIDLDSSCQKWISEVGLSNSTVAIIEADKIKGSDK